MELCSQRSRYSLQVVPGQFNEVDGLGLPFELLFFEARLQLFRATNALAHLQAEREYEREELLLDKFDLVDAYTQKVAEAAVPLLGCGIYSTRRKPSASFSGCGPTTTVWYLTTTKNSLGPGSRGPSELQSLGWHPSPHPTPALPPPLLPSIPFPSPLPPSLPISSLPILDHSPSLGRHAAAEAANNWRYRSSQRSRYPAPAPQTTGASATAATPAGPESAPLLDRGPAVAAHWGSGEIQHSGLPL
jgi:hypothetical protein